MPTFTRALPSLVLSFSSRLFFFFSAVSSASLVRSASTALVLPSSACPHGAVHARRGAHHGAEHSATALQKHSVYARSGGEGDLHEAHGFPSMDGRGHPYTDPYPDTAPHPL